MTYFKIFLLFLAFSISLNAQQPFITTWQTDNPGTSEDHQITIPGTGSEYLIEWEEVDNSANNGSLTGNDETIVNFPSPGTYRVEISGDFNRIRFNNEGDRLKLLSIDQWGVIQWENMAEAFMGCEYLVYRAEDEPNLSEVENMSLMFLGCRLFNGAIGDWDVSSVTNMGGLFQSTEAFNQFIGDWDVSNVSNMTFMFESATSFDQSIGDWDVSAVVYMVGMFWDAESFNQPIGDWDVSNVSNMFSMFGSATSFDQFIGDWDVSNVETMGFMFFEAESFNQPIGDWDVSSVTDMVAMFEGAGSFNQPIGDWDMLGVTQTNQMFRDAGSFNQPIGNWDVSNVIEMQEMFSMATSFNQDLGSWKLHPEVVLHGFLNNSGMSCENYDLTLIGWSENSNTPDNRTLGAVGIHYWQSEEARAKLIEEKGWTITGDEFVEGCIKKDCDLPTPILSIKGTYPTCKGEEVFLKASVEGVEYTWFKDGQPISGQHEQVLVVIEAGFYSVIYADDDNCESEESDALEVHFLEDTAPPVLLNGEDTVLRSTQPNCRGFAFWEAEIEVCGDLSEIENRSLWRLDLHNTGQFEIISTQPRPDGNERDNLRIEEELPFGTHRVQWEIRDEHGNLVIEEHLITLVDMNPPTPVCLHGIAASIHPSFGEITLPAWVYDVGSWDDCTDSEDLIFTFSSDLSHTHHTWTCDDLNGLGEKTLEVEIWVTNEYGHQNHCVTYIKIQDNLEACPDTAGVTIVVSGQVSNPASIPLEGAVIEVDNHFQTYYLSGNTNDEGRFELNVPVEEELVLRGHYSGYPLNGVSTFDIALIQRHILSIQALDSPYHRIAADVNDDGNIDVLDIAQLQKLILGKYTDFPDNNSWKVIVDEALDDSREVPAHRRVFELEGALRGLPDNDFIGIKIGDVNASHRVKGMPSEERILRETFNINVHDRTVKRGDLVEVVLSAELATELTGYQGTIQFEWERLEFVNYESGRIELTDAHFGFHRLDEGQITTSWSTPDPIDIKRGERLWTLYFEAKEEGQLSDLLALTSAITPAEAYTNLGTENLAIVFKGMEKDTKELVLHGNRPNPFHRQTTINYSLPEPSRVAITIFNSMGHVVKVMEKDQSAGHHEYPIHSSDLGSSGVYIYRIDASGQTRTGKLVLIK